MKIVQAKHVLIEQIALQLAATFYEVGRGQGLTSKYKNAKAYAKANLEKFIPKSVEYCLEMLKEHSNATPEMKEAIYDALMERHNDPELNTYRPNFDVKAIIAQIDAIEKRKQIVINTEPKTVIHK